MGLTILGHDVSISGFQTTFLEYYNGIQILPMATGLDEISQLQNNIIKTNSEILIYINDGYTDARKFITVFPRTITYTPIEGFDIPNHMIINLNRVAENSIRVSENGRVVAQCSYGFKEMKKAGINVCCYIYHGFNPDIFYPIDSNRIETESKFCFYKTEQGQSILDPKLLYTRGCENCKFDIKEQIKCPFYREEKVIVSKYDNINNQWLQIEDVPISKLRANINPSNKFMFLGVAANHMIRKKLERLLKAYSILIDTKQLADRICLHLHTNPISPTGIDLLEISNRLKIQNNVTFSYGNWSEQAVNILYNISDVGVSASSSEGFGLDTLQSMTVGNPYIAPDCTSFTELIGEIIEDPIRESKTIGPRGLLAKIQADYMLQDLTYRSLVDEVDLASKMKEIYSDKKLRDQYSKNALKFASNYTWEKTCDQFNELIKTIST
jgi:glycosyltransferase involved in cell wall biosynthesis